MNEKIKIRSSEMSEIQEILSTHNTTYNTNRSPKQWLWEYTGNYPDLFVFIVIEDEGKIVGTQGMIPIYLNIKGQRYLSGKSENTLLYPNYRGKRYFQDLYKFAVSLCTNKNMTCIWGYTPVIAAKTGLRKKIGFSVYENLMYKSYMIINLKKALLDIRNSDMTIRKKYIRNIITISRFFLSRLHTSFILPKKYSKKKYSMEPQIRSFDDLAKLYGRLREKYPDLIHIEQDEKYVKWRIYNNPNIKYKTYFVYENEILRGYCYVGTKDQKTVYLTDITFENDEVGTFLLQELIKKWMETKIGYASFFGNVMNPLMISNFNLLGKFGFRKSKSDIAIVLKNISIPDEKHLYNVKNWYASGLWTEGYSM